MSESPRYVRVAPQPSLTAVAVAGAGVALTITTLLAFAKLLGVIDPSWWIVAAPVWMPVVGGWSIVVLGGLGAMLLYPSVKRDQR
jgi:hypothetical protein